MAMTADLANIIGLVAGSLTTVAYLPQVVKIWKTKSARDLSLGMFVTLSAGIFLWLVYGILIGSLPVILANAATLVFSGFVLFLKIRYR
jgi:MtN3 and saliva related transmembrane protein